MFPLGFSYSILDRLGIPPPLRSALINTILVHTTEQVDIFRNEKLKKKKINKIAKLNKSIENNSLRYISINKTKGHVMRNML